MFTTTPNKNSKLGGTITVLVILIDLPIYKLKKKTLAVTGESYKILAKTKRNI